MITRLYIDNFRCFTNFEFRPMKPSPAIFIGTNGVGKTTLGRVLALLRDFALGRDVSAYLNAQSIAYGRTDRVVRCDVDFLEGGKRIYSRFEFDYLEGSPSWKLRSEAASCEDVPGDEALKMTRDYFARLVVVKPHPEDMTSTVRAEEGEQLAYDCHNLVSWLAIQQTRKPQIYADVCKYLALVFPDFMGYRYRQEGLNGTRLVCQFKTDAEALCEMDFAALSDGEKCQFLAAVLCAVNMSAGNLFCFWDEPDNYITTGEVAYLFPALCHAFLKGGQFWSTSHSESGILTYEDEETYVMGRRNHAGAVLPVVSITDLRKDGRISGSLGEALRNGEVL